MCTLFTTAIPTSFWFLWIFLNTCIVNRLDSVTYIVVVLCHTNLRSKAKNQWCSNRIIIIILQISPCTPCKCTQKQREWCLCLFMIHNYKSLSNVDSLVFRSHLFTHWLSWLLVNCVSSIGRVHIHLKGIPEKEVECNLISFESVSHSLVLYFLCL